MNKILCPHGKNPHDCDIACCPGPTDNKAPRQWVLIVCNETDRVKEVRKVGQGGLRCNDHKVYVIEKSYADNLQSRLERCEGLLRSFYDVDEIMDAEIRKYFAEIEK